MTDKTPISPLVIPDQQKTPTEFGGLPFPFFTIDNKGKIHEMNQAAQNFLKISDYELQNDLNLCTISLDFRNNMKLIAETATRNEHNSRKILLRRHDNSIACVNINVSISSENKNLYLILFSESGQKDQLFFAELTQTFRREVMRLRPYLNKAGKELMQEIVENNLLESIGQQKAPVTDIEDIKEKLLNEIAQAFPELTKNELTMCGFLSMKMSIEEIAILTGKSTNCLRVTLHRIVKKTHCRNSRQLNSKLIELKSNI
ncbi:MAG TPA: hypothetical protein VK152_11815 [Paludibacter sp.]|nr:hypothetical protein [Paludibacter sp.]